jgi:hypothetical protein
MRTFRVLIAACAVITLLITPASAAPASNGDFVSGSGYRLSADGTERRAEFNAYAQADTNGAWGSYWFRQLAASFNFSGQVKCLDVAGNQAAIGGVITRSSGVVSAGDKFLVFVVDNGEDPANPDIVSQTYVLPSDAGNVTVPRNFPSVCPNAETTSHDAFQADGDLAIGNVNS